MSLHPAGHSVAGYRLVRLSVYLPDPDIVVSGGDKSCVAASSKAYSIGHATPRVGSGTAAHGSARSHVPYYNGAVVLTADGPVAYRRTGTGYDTVPVKLGQRNQKYVQVKAGLREGDEVSRTDLGERELSGS